MPNSPGIGQVYANKYLTNVMIDWANTAHELIKVFPTVPVQQESGWFFKFDNPDAFRDEAEIRGIGSEAVEINIAMGTKGEYRISEIAAKAAIYDRIRANSDTPLRIDVKAAQRAVNKVDLKRETLIASQLVTTGNWSPAGGNIAITAGQEWNSSGLGDPVGVIDTLIESIQSGIMQRPNKIVTGRAVWNVLKRHPHVREWIKTSRPEIPSRVTKAAVAEFFEVSELIVIDGIKVTSAPGAATTTYAPTWADASGVFDYLWAGYVTASPSTDEPSAGYVFQLAAGIQGVNWREERMARTMVEARKYFDVKVGSALCGGLISNCLG